MLRLILLSLFTIPFTSAINFCQNNTWIPGLATLQSGFDARTSQWSGLPIWTSSSSADFDTWSPTGDPTCVYKVPKPVALLSTSYSQEQLAQSLSVSYQEFLQAFASYYSFGIDASIGAFGAGFQYSKELADVHYHLSIQGQAQGFAEHFWHVYKLASPPSFLLRLDDTFAHALDYLPTTIQSPEDLHKYNEVVRAYGTHNPISANFGGSIRVHDYVSQAYVKNFSAKFVLEQMGFLFHWNMFNISSGGFISREEIQKKLNITFMRAVNQTVIFSGGASSLQTNTTLSQWVLSIPYLATAQNMTLRPLSEFITDKTKSNTWDKFVLQYLNQSAPHISANNDSYKIHVLDMAYYLGHGVDTSAISFGIGKLPWFEYRFVQEQQWGNNWVRMRSFSERILCCVQVPDEIQIIPRTQSIWSNVTIVAINGSDFQHIQSQYSSSMFSSSQRVHFFQKLYVEQRNFSLSDLAISFGKVVLPISTFPKLSPLFLSSLDRLRSFTPIPYVEWKRFFQMFGTEVMDTAEMGGRMQFQSWTHSNLLKNKSVDYFIQQSGWSFFGIIGNGQGHASYDSRLNAAFMSSTQQTLSYWGGESSSIQYPSQWRKWANTIPDNALPLTWSSTPIDQVLRLYGFDDLAVAVRPMVQRYLEESHAEFLLLEQQYRTQHQEHQKFKPKNINPPPTMDRQQIKQRIERLALSSAGANEPYATFHGFETRGNSSTLPSRIGLGWNRLTKDLGLPVFQLTYNKQQRWKSWIVPDQVTLTPVSIQRRHVDPSKTLQILFDKIRVSSSEIDPYDPTNASIGFYADTQSILDLAARYFGDDTSMSIQQETIVNYTLEWTEQNPTSIVLDEHLKHALEQLPSHYDAELYALVLKYWGTHVILQADVGGAVEQIIRLRNCVWNMGEDMSPLFLVDLLAQVYPVDYKIDALNKFYLDRRQASTVMMIGGDPRMALAVDWSKRVDSLEQWPALVSISASSWLRYIEDPIKRSNFERVIRECLVQAEQQEQEQLQMAIQKLLISHEVWGFGQGNSWFDYHGIRIPDFWLGSRKSWNMSISTTAETSRSFPDSHESSQWWQPVGICERNAEGMLRARYVTTAHSEIKSLWHPISHTDGPFITSGCSTATQTWDCNDKHVCPIFDSPAVLRVDCCQYCQPKIVPVCNYRVCGLKLQSCECPKLFS